MPGAMHDHGPWPMGDQFGAGNYLIEILLLSPLADAGIAAFCFILLPTKFKSATGSPVRPIAMV